MGFLCGFRPPGEGRDSKSASDSEVGLLKHLVLVPCRGTFSGRSKAILRGSRIGSDSDITSVVEEVFWTEA